MRNPHIQIRVVVANEYSSQKQAFTGPSIGYVVRFFAGAEEIVADSNLDCELPFDQLPVIRFTPTELLEDFSQRFWSCLPENVPIIVLLDQQPLLTFIRYGGRFTLKGTSHENP